MESKYQNHLYENLVILLMIWTVFQDFVLGIILNIISVPSLVKILFYAKDVLFLGLFGWSMKKVGKIKIGILVWLILFFTLLILEAIYAFLKDISFMNMFSSIRGWLLLPGFVAIGFSIEDKEYFQKRLLKYFTTFLFIAAVFGILDYLVDVYVFSTIPFWTKFVGIGEYMIKIKGQEGRLAFGLPGNFYGQYGGEFFSQKRLVSFWGGPLTAGYILSIGFFVSLFYSYNKEKGSWNKMYLLAAITIFLAIGMTYTRAMILQLGIIVFLLPFIFFPRTRPYYLLVLPIGLFVFLWKHEKIISYIYDGSTMEHIRQFSTSLFSISIFGSGIASYGVNSNIGTESAFISCLGQMGILGLGLYLISFIYPLYLLFKTYLKKKDPLLIATFISGIVFFVSGFISEQLLAYTSIAPFYVLLGYCLKETNFNVYEDQPVIGYDGRLGICE